VIHQCDQCKTLHAPKCCPAVYLDAQVVEPSPDALPQEITIGGLVDSLLSTLGARLTPSPLPTAIALFGAPGWFVPVMLAGAAAAGVGGLYAAGRRGKKSKSRKRRARR
jgi:hypothetical protein